MKTGHREFSKYVSVPSGAGTRVDKSVVINRPVTEVYSFWRQLENLPLFMRHLQSVKILDGLHSHWTVQTLGGKRLEWDTEIIDQRKNEMISWRSEPGAGVDNAGSVWFTRLPGGAATSVRLELKYAPPGGKAGALAAKFFGYNVDDEIGEDLIRLKIFLETGRLPAPRAASRTRQQVADAARKAARTADDIVHENPWTAIACVAIGFLALGFLLEQGRKRS
jgi:uncharacterized membrane protein